MTFPTELDRHEAEAKRLSCETAARNASGAMTRFDDSLDDDAVGARLAQIDRDADRWSMAARALEFAVGIALGFLAALVFLAVTRS
jgi:hypothetical protein